MAAPLDPERLIELIETAAKNIVAPLWDDVRKDLRYVHDLTDKIEGLLSRQLWAKDQRIAELERRIGQMTVPPKEPE